MKNSYALIHATLIVMGAGLATFPAIYDLVISSQQSFLLAHNPSPSRYPGQDLSGLADFAFFLLGVAMIFIGGRPAHSRPESKM